MKHLSLITSLFLLLFNCKLIYCQNNPSNYFKHFKIKYERGVININDKQKTKLDTFGRKLDSLFKLYNLTKPIKTNPRIIKMLPVISKKEFLNNPCLGLQRYRRIKEYLNENFKLPGVIIFRYADTKYESKPDGKVRSYISINIRTE